MPSIASSMQAKERFDHHGWLRDLRLGEHVSEGQTIFVYHSGGRYYPATALDVVPSNEVLYVEARVTERGDTHVDWYPRASIALYQE